MGVQGRGKKKSEVEELRKQVLGMRMEIDELKRATQPDREDGFLEAGTAVASSSSRAQRVTAHRRDSRRRAPSESDDEEETPE